MYHHRVDSDQKQSQAYAARHFIKNPFQTTQMTVISCKYVEMSHCQYNMFSGLSGGTYMAVLMGVSIEIEQQKRLKNVQLF